MFGLGIGELVVIGLFALLFIGPKKLPELAKGLGKGIREFQRAKDEIVKTVKDPGYGVDDVKKVAEKSKDSDQALKDLGSVKPSTVSTDILSEVKPPELASIARGENLNTVSDEAEEEKS